MGPRGTDDGGRFDPEEEGRVDSVPDLPVAPSGRHYEDNDTIKIYSSGIVRHRPWGRVEGSRRDDGVLYRETTPRALEP